LNVVKTKEWETTDKDRDVLNLEAEKLRTQYKDASLLEV
jgi:hypothetical protein